MADKNGTQFSISESLPVPVTHPSRVLSIQHSIAAAKEAFSPKLDDLEWYLLPRVKDDESVKRFLRDYLEFKSNKAGAELIDSLFQYMVLDNGTQSHVSDLEFFRMNLHSRESFSECLKSMKTQMLSRINNYPDALHLCIISFNAPEVVRNKAYSFFIGKLVMYAIQLETKYQSPRLAIVYVLDQLWNLTPDVMEKCTCRFPEVESGWSVKLPSQANTQSGLHPAPSSALDQIPLTFRLTWQYAVSKYRNDLNVYAWRPFAEKPRSECAEIFLQPAKSVSHSILIVLTSSDNSTRLIEGYRDKRSSKLPYNIARPHAITTDVVISLYVIYMQIIEDGSAFLADILDTVARMKYIGRIVPSGSKIEYLLHLEDCRRLAVLSLENASSVLQTISPLVKNDSANEAALFQWSSSIADDLFYLRKELETVEIQIASLQAMIKSQIDVHQSRRTALLTLLASIYIPFSFISSLFGMNLTNPLWSAANSPPPATPEPQPLSTNASSLSQPDPAEIISAIQTSGPFLFSFQSYWYISVAVTVATILLPLIAGITFRWTIQLWAKAKLYWRYGIFWLLSSYNVNAFQHYFYQNYISGIVVLFCVYKLAVAMQHKNRRRVWLVWTMVYASAWALELTVIPQSAFVGCIIQVHFCLESLWRVRHLSSGRLVVIRTWFSRCRLGFYSKKGND